MPEKLIKHNKKKALKKHGFMSRNNTVKGRQVLKRRRSKGRKRLAING